jgi:hypothetical protein
VRLLREQIPTGLSLIRLILPAFFGFYTYQARSKLIIFMMLCFEKIFRSMERNSKFSEGQYFRFLKLLAGEIF